MRDSATGAPLFYHSGDTVPAPVPAWFTELPATAISPAASAVVIGTDIRGVPAGGLVRRAALAWALQEPDLLQPPSGQVSVDWARDPRERVLKLAVWVERSVRRIVLHLPQAFAWRDAWQPLAQALGAT